MSVLQSMAAGIAADVVKQKAAKAAGLTPVAGETTTTVAEAAALIAIPDVPEVFLTQEAVADISRDLRRQAAVLIDVADGLDKYKPGYLVTDEAPKVGKVEARLAGKDPVIVGWLDKPLAEFKADFDDLQAAAQAATFTSLDDGAADDEPTGWVCPTHGAESLTTITPRNGEPYLMCDVSDCEHYERK